MSRSKQSPPQGMTRKQEREASRLLGRHVSPEKALAAILATSLCCLLPILLGLRLWEQIPPIVETGLVDLSGQDDSMPRPVLVFAVPGLGFVLNAIVHGQLWLHQKAEKIPPTPSRLLGRWTIPPLSLLLSSFWILGAASQPRDAAFFLPCLLGLALLLLGGHFFDCDRDARIAFRLERLRLSERRWRTVHRIAGVSWMLAGLLLPGLLFSLGALPLWSAAPMLLLLASPLAAACLVK